MSLVGSTIGTVELQRLLGLGGMGEVYLGFDRKLERRVAVKTILPEARLSAEAKARLLQEARVLSRLEHRAICQIHDLLETPDGEFLILEYVEGETLKQHATRALGNDEKLRLAGEIAAALVVAHRAQIVHRDLKADNIMVTADGSVKILDFGIARLLLSPTLAPVRPQLRDTKAEGIRLPPGLKASTAEAARTLSLGPEGVEEPTPSTLIAADEDRLTRRGALLGTLETMSPEQVVGEAVSTASDLYSLGILLQELFTGAPAYPQTTPAELITRVAQAETVTPQGLDPELAQLLRELLSRQPEARPSAAEAQARLAALRDKPTRLQQRRRRRALVSSIVATLLAGLVVVSWLAVAAERARRVARERQEQAEGLIRFMLGDLREKLEGVGRLELLDNVGDRALAYFDAAPGTRLSDEEALQRVEAFELVGRVRLAQGRVDGASQAFEQARHLAAAELARLPGSSRAQRAVFSARTWVGQVKFGRGDLAGALAEWQGAVVELERHAAPDEPLLGKVLASGYHNLGTALHSQGDLDAALAAYQRSLDLQAPALAAEPSDQELAADHATTLSWMSSVLEGRGDLTQALTTRERYVEILRGLAANAPLDAERQLAAAEAEGFLAGLKAAQGETEAALALYREGFAVVRKLAEADPENVDLRRWRGAFAHNLARVLAQRGRVPEAASFAREAVATLTELHRANPEDPDWRRQLGVAHLRSAQALHPRGTEARVDAEAALALLAPAIGETDPAALGMYGEALLALHRLELASGRAEAAQVALSTAITRLAPVAGSTQDWHLLEPYARALVAAGRHEEARPVLDLLNAMGLRSPTTSSQNPGDLRP